MLKKRIKTLVVSCVLVCILPITSIAMDKDEFLKFLVNSSYPESKGENEVKENKENTNTQKNEKDYMKFHVGEENIPTINNEKSKEETTDNTNNENSSIVANSSKYINDVRVTKDQPRILLYHTHTGETYSNSPGGNYHSQDKPNSVLEIGTMLTDELTKRGWGVVHSSKYHDYPSFNGAYMSSRQTLDALMPKYPSVDIAIDLHRDGRDLTDSVAMKNEHKRATTTYKGESVAKFLFVVGMKNENVSHVQELANDITAYAMKKYPELVLPVVKKPYGKFNQSVAPNHLLIEVGSNGTTIQESQASVKYIADVLDGYFKTK